ncbi:formate dehydrogenase accessory sulfurtransferase FdhD [Clostridium sp.]
MAERLKLMEVIRKINIIRYKSSLKEEMEDWVIEEKPLNIFINNKYYATLMCTPNEVEELCVGFLFSNGMITSKDDIKQIEFSTGDIVFINLEKEIEADDFHKRALVSGCGGGLVDINMISGNNLNIVKSQYTFSGEKMLKLMKEFNTMSNLFQQTGGAHSCCICGDNGIEFLSEDIGRHNAIDKTIGKCLLNDIERNSKMLFTTGRISSDILVKTAKAGIPVLVSHSGPTDLAVDIAKKLNMTVVGFARGTRMNIYCGSERLLFGNS